MAKNNSTKGITPAEQNQQEFSHIKTDANGSVFMTTSANSLRKWRLEEVVDGQPKTTFYIQNEEHVQKFLRRGDIFELDKLDAFRLKKLGKDKKFPVVVECSE